MVRTQPGSDWDIIQTELTHKTQLFKLIGTSHIEKEIQLISLQSLYNLQKIKLEYVFRCKTPTPQDHLRNPSSFRICFQTIRIPKSIEYSLS